MDLVARVAGQLDLMPGEAVSSAVDEIEAPSVCIVVHVASMPGPGGDRQAPARHLAQAGAQVRAGAEIPQLR